MKKENENFKIGIIGPINSCKKIEKVIREDYPEFQIAIYPGEKAESAHELVVEAERECDGLVFTGIGVYSKIREKYEMKKPHIYINYGYDSILKVLWNLRDLFPGTREISIDTVEKEEIDYLIKEFQIEDLVAHVLPYSKNLGEEDYLAFHRSFAEKKEKVVAISGFDWVYNQLKSENINSLRLYAIRKGIKSRLEKLLHMLRLKDEQDSSICVQIFQIMTGTDEGTSPYRALEIGADFKSSLVEYLKSIKGSIFSLGLDRYIIFSTLGAVRISKNQLRLKNTLNILEKKNVRIAVGTGVGKSAYESEVNANRALNLAKQEKRSAIYEVTPRETRGPLSERRMVAIEHSKPDSRYEKISEKAKVSLLTVERIKNLLVQEKRETATSEEIALQLDTTVRNANRIIKKFLEAGLCEIHDTVSINRAGRPKKIIKFNF